MPIRVKSQVKRLLKTVKTLPEVEPHYPVFPAEFKNVSGFRKTLWWSTTRHGINQLLRYGDRNSMAHSREVRQPFLDHRLVEYVFELPERLLVKDVWTKWILREAFKEIVPSDITMRVDKLAYMPPQEKWLGHQSWPDIMLTQLAQLTKSSSGKPT